MSTPREGASQASKSMSAFRADGSRKESTDRPRGSRAREGRGETRSKPNRHAREEKKNNQTVMVEEGGKNEADDLKNLKDFKNFISIRR